MKKQIAGISLSALAFAATAHAVATATTASQTNGTDTLDHTFTPSSTDLLSGLSPSAFTGRDGGMEGTSTAVVLTDGAFPSPITRDAGGPFQFSAFAVAGNAGGAAYTSLTYTLPAISDIGSIVVYGGWQDGGRDEQSYSILYSTTVGGAFLPLISNVDFNPPFTSHPQVTRVSIADDVSSTLQAGVAQIQFNFNATENGYSGYSEIDVVAVPEPSAFLALAGGTAMLLGFRRRTA